MNRGSHGQRRKITSRRYYRTDSHPIHAGDSVLCDLECGHSKHYKGSQEPKSDFAYCRECYLEFAQEAVESSRKELAKYGIQPSKTR